MKKFIALLMAIVGLACSGVLAIADSHNWNEGEWIQLPSCSVQGQRKYTCTNPGCDAQYVEQVGMLEHFFLPADAASVSDWAAKAVEWAVGEQLLTGKTGSKLDPTGGATRAEVAQILMRFAQEVAEK